MKDQIPRTPLHAAVLDANSGKIERIQPVTRPEKLSVKQVVEKLKDLKVVPKDSHTGTEFITLSAQRTWVENKGWLEAVNPRTLYASEPNMSWVPEQGQPVGHLGAWLENLTPHTLYIAQIEVGSSGNGQFDVRPVSLGASNNFYLINADPGFQSLMIPFDSGDGNLAYLTVSHPNWSFYEMTVIEVG